MRRAGGGRAGPSGRTALRWAGSPTDVLREALLVAWLVLVDQLLYPLGRFRRWGAAALLALSAAYVGWLAFQPSEGPPALLTLLALGAFLAALLEGAVGGGAWVPPSYEFLLHQPVRPGAVALGLWLGRGLSGTAAALLASPLALALWGAGAAVSLAALPLYVSALQALAGAAAMRLGRRRAWPLLLYPALGALHTAAASAAAGRLELSPLFAVPLAPLLAGSPAAFPLSAAYFAAAAGLLADSGPEDLLTLPRLLAGGLREAGRPSLLPSSPREAAAALLLRRREAAAAALGVLAASLAPGPAAFLALQAFGRPEAHYMGALFAFLGPALAATVAASIACRQAVRHLSPLWLLRIYGGLREAAALALARHALPFLLSLVPALPLLYLQTGHLRLLAAAAAAPSASLLASFLVLYIDAPQVRRPEAAAGMSQPQVPVDRWAATTAASVPLALAFTGPDGPGALLAAAALLALTPAAYKVLKDLLVERLEELEL